LVPSKKEEQMNLKNRRGGFTLIEVLIVVVIMAVLAATIIPQFTSSSKDARESSAKFNLHSLRSIVEMYKLHHAGALPAGTNDLEQLTKATNQAGVVGASGPSYPYGPYVQNTLPVNPFNNLATVKVITSGTAGTPPTADDSTGWIYRSSTGEIFINTPDYEAL
jgi:general secretion pathway protein G